VPPSAGGLAVFPRLPVRQWVLSVPKRLRYCCVIDGVFEPIADADDEEIVVFHAACGLDAVAIADVQGVVRQRILRAFVRRGLISKDDGNEMGGWEHGGGFSVDASVRIEGTDRPGLERLLRYCAPKEQRSCTEEVLLGCARPSRWSICTNAMPSIWSTATQGRRAERRPAHARRRWS
jgi:hypothetical protein